MHFQNIYNAQKDRLWRQNYAFVKLSWLWRPMGSLYVFIAVNWNSFAMRQKWPTQHLLYSIYNTIEPFYRRSSHRHLQWKFLSCWVCAAIFIFRGVRVKSLVRAAGAAYHRWYVVGIDCMDVRHMPCKLSSLYKVSTYRLSYIWCLCSIYIIVSPFYAVT